MTLATSRFTQALLDLEDADPDVLLEALPGSDVPLWPQVRMMLAYAMSAQELTSVTVEAAPERFGRLKRVARAALPSREDVRSLSGRRDVLFLVGGTTTYRSDAGVRNWLVGDFADGHPGDAAIVQWRPLMPGAQAFADTRSLDALQARAEVRNRLRPRDVGPQVQRLVREYARLLDFDIADEKVEAVIAEAAYTTPLRARLNEELGRVLDRLQPRVVLFEDAVDGGWGATVAAMKDRGIRVAEPQHGWIGPSHAAYNFGAALRRPELARAVPDELLTFGSYWGEGLRYPADVTVIGKPHLEAQVAGVSAVGDRPREVLVVSSVGEPQRTSAFVLRLAAALPAGWTVRFRPHPSERATVGARYPELVGAARVTLDERLDVYESLAASRIVVGVASTVLFEAVAMGCRVFVRDTPYVPVIVGGLFGAPVGDEDVSRIVAATAGDHDRDALAVAPEALWQPGAVGRFEEWLARPQNEVL